MGPAVTFWARLTGLARKLILAWALAGGAILIALVLMTAASAASNLFFNRPFTGDFEIVKHCIAIVAFMFLPYCQISYSNVTVDIFTEGAGERAKSTMVVLSSLVALAFSLLLLRQMWLGMWDYIRYQESMVSVPIALWTAFPPALASLLLLSVASFLTLEEGVRGVRRIASPVME